MKFVLCSAWWTADEPGPDLQHNVHDHAHHYCGELSGAEPALVPEQPSPCPSTEGWILALYLKTAFYWIQVPYPDPDLGFS